MNYNSRCAAVVIVVVFSTATSLLSLGATTPVTQPSSGSVTGLKVPFEVERTIREQAGHGEVVAVERVQQGPRVRFLADIKVQGEQRRYYICECGAIGQIDIKCSLDEAPAAVRRTLEQQGGRVRELTKVNCYGVTFYRATVEVRNVTRMMKVTPTGELTDQLDDESEKLPKSSIA